ncbi:hypothetical protein LX36DRAFT_485915 [Colletotrichum falcatum]|nr:hypothetical protein LX36DRAFT_485915 [Colletotrichum falcatum]
MFSFCLQIPLAHGRKHQHWRETPGGERGETNVSATTASHPDWHRDTLNQAANDNTTPPPTRTRNTEHDTFSFGRIAQHGAMALFSYSFPFLGSCNHYSFRDHGTISGKGLYFLLLWLPWDLTLVVFLGFPSFFRTRTLVLLTSALPPQFGEGALVSPHFLFLVYLHGKGIASLARGHCSLFLFLSYLFFLFFLLVSSKATSADVGTFLI